MADNKFLDSYKEYKNIDVDDDTDDKVLNKVLDGGQAYLKYTYSLYLEKETIKPKYNGKGLDFLVLPSKYVSINSVKVGGSEIDSDNLYLNDNLLYYIQNVFPVGIQNIEVDMDIGWDSDDKIPRDIKLAFFIVADKFYENIKKNTNNFSSVDSLNYGKIDLLNQLPPTFYHLINPHISFKVI